MTTSHIPEQSGSRHGLVEGKEKEENSLVKQQKNHHDIQSSSTPDDPPREAVSRASRFRPDNTSPSHPVHLAEPSASALLYAADEHLEHHVRDAGLPCVSEDEDASTFALFGGPERVERESHFPPLEHRGERSPEHHHHHHDHDGLPTPVRCHTVLHEESEARDDDDDDDNAAPPHPHPHLQLPRRSPQRRGRVDLSPPPFPIKPPNAAAGAGGGGGGGGGEVGGAGATTGHQRSSSAPVKPLKSAFAAPKSPPLAYSSPSSETGRSGSGATSPSSAGMKKRARFEDEDGGLEGGGRGGRASGELSLMLGRGLGGLARSPFSGEDQEEGEAGFAEKTLIEGNDDGQDVDLPASSQDEVADDDDAGLEVGAGNPEIGRQISSDESVRDVLQAEVDDAADEFHEDAAMREDASMGERDSASGGDELRDDEERSLDLREDIVSPLQDPAYDQEGSDQEDEGPSAFALAEHDQATDDSRTRFFDDQGQLNADVELDHQSSELRPLASIDEGKATQRARLPFFSRPQKPANLRRLSDSQAERDLQNEGIVPRRASSMGDFNSLQGRSTLRPLPAKAAPAGVALTATSVHSAEQHKINPIYQHPNARWRHDIYDSRKPTRTEQTVYSGNTKYQVLWEEPPQSDTDSDTTLIMESSQTPQVVEPDSDSILAHISRSPSPMGKLRTKLAAWSWAKEQEELGMEDEEEEDEDEAGQGGGGVRAKATSQLMPAAGATCLLSTRRRSPIEDATGSEGPPAPPNTAKSGASSAQRSAPQTPFLECRDEGGQCGIRVEAPDAFDPDTGHTVESQGEFFDVDDVGERSEEEAGLVIGLGSSSSSSWSNAAAADMHRLLKPALSRVRSATLPSSPATTTTLDYLSFPATASSSRLPGPSLLSSSILQQQQQQHYHHNLANPSLSRHFSNLTQEEEDRFRTHRDSVDIHHRRLNNEEKMNTHLQATRDSFLITKSKYDARPRSHNPYLPLQQHQHPSSSLSSPTHIQYSRFGGLSPILDASPPSSETATTTTKQSGKAVPISSSASSKTPSGEVPVKVTVLEGEESSSEEDEPVESAAHPDEHVGCAICAVKRPRWFEARQQRRKMQV